MSLTFPVGHQMILASAGSGKTHDLTTRFCTLMAAGVPPERIIALTFSRKAAGEFFSRILTRMARAALSASEAARLEAAICEQEIQHANHLGSLLPLPRPPVTQANATAMLVTLVQRLHLLSLGTMDSFFIRMARSCPLELGLSGDFGILDQSRSDQIRQRIYQQIFRSQGTQRADQEDFLRAFDEATYGREETSLIKKLDSFIKDSYQKFTETRPQELWGQPGVIWPQGGAPRDPGCSVAEAARAAMEHLAKERGALNADQVEVLHTFLVEMETRHALQPIPGSAQRLLVKMTEVFEDLRNGAAALMLDRKSVELDPPLCQRLFVLMEALLHDDFTAGCLQTQGIWRILHDYDQQYETLVRQQGELSFSDVQQLLSGDLANGGAEKFALTRSLLEFRLDAKFDHWLLDEFQDTNRRQWGILEGLIEEVLQDDSGTRTFFAVGDVKQAIHMWRGSDPDLMGRLLDRYANAPQRIAVLAKFVSWRCAPAVLELANAALGDRARLDAWLVPGTLQESWNFETHSAAPVNQGRAGFAEVMVVQTPKKKGAKAEGPAVNKEEASLALICDRMLQLDPLARGLTCVVLVLTNNQALSAAEYLRAATPFPVSCETDVGIVGLDAACSGLLDILRLAIHPHDAFARIHLEMSPWQEVARGMTGPGDDNPWIAAAAMVRAQICQDGFARTLRNWIGQLRAICPELPAYSIDRLQDLQTMATEFDLTGRRDIDEFIEQANDRKTRESSRAASIQVMTVFKAKGLEWDMVFATGFHDPKHGGVFDNDAVAYDDERKVAWITRIPNKDLALCNPTILAMDEERQRWRWRQNICLLYVTLTRAKSATCVVLLQPSEISKSKRLDTLMLEMLQDEEGAAMPIHSMGDMTVVSCRRHWHTGTEDWFEAYPLQPSAAAEPLPPVGFPAPIPASPTPAVPATRPAIFSLARHQALSLGTSIHAEIARVRWLSPGRENDVPESLRPFLRHRSVADIFTEPASPTRLWIEQPFDLIHQGSHLSGIFDRAHITVNDAGLPISAILYDFKSDQIERDRDLAEIAAGYRAQMNFYVQALNSLLGLERKQISSKLVFLHHGRIVNIDG